MTLRGTIALWFLALWLAAAGGCASLSYPNFWPFPEYERTTYHTPSMRVDAVKQFAERSTHVDSPEQQKLTDQLARQIQIEPDPIVRLAVVQTVAEFRRPWPSRCSRRASTTTMTPCESRVVMSSATAPKRPRSRS